MAAHFQIGAEQIFRRRAHEGGQEKQRERLSLQAGWELLKHGGEQDCAEPVDRQPRTVEETAVCEGAVHTIIEKDLP